VSIDPTDSMVIFKSGKMKKVQEYKMNHFTFQNSHSFLQKRCIVNKDFAFILEELQRSLDNDIWS
jgi:hypothetical protein